FDAIPPMAPNVKAGQVRALGTSAARRSTGLPDVPTIPEAGGPGYESTIWLGIMAPAGTPKAIVDLLNAEINKAISRPDVKEAWDKQGAVALVMTPAEFDAYLRKDIEKWAQVVKVSGAKAEYRAAGCGDRRRQRRARAAHRRDGHVFDIARALQTAENIARSQDNGAQAGEEETMLSAMKFKIILWGMAQLLTY